MAMVCNDAGISSLPFHVFVSACMVGCWNAGLICGVRTLFRPFKLASQTMGATDQPPLVSNPTLHAGGAQIQPGWFVGSCTNTTMGISANLLLVIHGATETGVHGELYLSGDLGGGGPFNGNIGSSVITFTTCVPTAQTAIEWQGHIVAEQISGNYTVKRITRNWWLGVSNGSRAFGRVFLCERQDKLIPIKSARRGFSITDYMRGL